MKRDLHSFVLATMLLFAAGTIAMAQGRGGGGFGGNSGFGGGMGGSGFGMGGGFGGGGSGFGGGGFGNSAFGSGGFGAGGFGQSGTGGGFGGAGMGGSAFSRGGGFGGQGMGGGGMGGQNFVGRDSGDMQAIMGQMGRAGTQFFNTMSRNMNRNRNQQRRTQSEENERPEVRIRLEVGFDTPATPPSAVASNISTRLASLAIDHSIGRPQVSVEGDTVVLRGIAESDSQKRVLEQFVMLEPGVMNVRNEMVVAQPPTEEPLPVLGN